MGCGFYSKTAPISQNNIRNVVTHRLLLLGAGEAGKSTIFKQVRLQKKNGFDDIARESYRQAIHDKIIQWILDLTNVVEQEKLISVASEIKKINQIRNANSPILIGNLSNTNPTNNSLNNNNNSSKPMSLHRGSSSANVHNTNHSSHTTHSSQNVAINANNSNNNTANNNTNQLNIDEKVLFACIKKIWNLEAIQNAFHHHFTIKDDSTERLFSQEHFTRLASAEYVPTDEDILHFRNPTKDISEIEYMVNDHLQFVFIDVGGQRTERIKWNAIADVTAVIFVVAMDEYNKTLVEDTSRNRMKESLLLFKMIAARHFMNKPIILLLNKKDLFIEKIQHIDLNICFPNYEDGCNYQKAAIFIQKEFQEAAGEREDVYYYRTCATESTQIIKVFEALEDIITKHNVKNSFET